MSEVLESSGAAAIQLDWGCHGGVACGGIQHGDAPSAAISPALTASAGRAGNQRPARMMATSFAEDACRLRGRRSPDHGIAAGLLPQVPRPELLVRQIRERAQVQLQMGCGCISIIDTTD